MDATYWCWAKLQGVSNSGLLYRSYDKKMIQEIENPALNTLNLEWPKYFKVDSGFILVF